MKFLVPNYSCLQNPWLRGYRPQIPFLSVLCPQLNLLNPPPQKEKFLGTPLWQTKCYAHIKQGKIMTLIFTFYSANLTTEDCGLIGSRQSLNLTPVCNILHWRQECEESNFSLLSHIWNDCCQTNRTEQVPRQFYNLICSDRKFREYYRMSFKDFNQLLT